jgi:GYF domain 2
MDYLVQRGEEQFGPYTLAELQEYAQSGRILATDLAKSEGLADWVPVSQILGNIPAPVAVSASTISAPPEPTVPLPPNLHWSLVLILGLLTRQLFNCAWAFVQANWARKLSGNNKAMVYVAMYPAGIISGMVAIVAAAAMHREEFVGIGVVLFVAGLIFYIIGIFKIRDAMEDYYNSRERFGLVLSGAMTFFFSTVYLQYHINRIARWKKTGIID